MQLSQRLYLRIWLAVVSALVLLTLLAGWLWQLDRERERAERPGREIVIYNAQGEVLGQAPARPVRMPGQGPLEFRVVTRDGEALVVQLPRPHRPPHGVASSGWRWQSMGFGTLLAVMALAVALGAYPVVRWLTQRLERLQQGVERWGDGDLSARVPEQGNDEVAFLAQRFNHAAQRVQALVQSHKTLLANASHELRSPLARIRMGLALMEGATVAQCMAQQADIARDIAELDQLIDEILLSSRLDSPEGVPLQREEIDLTGLAAEECARLGASLTIQAQPLVDGDARLLRRLVRNLLENARRHGLRTDGYTADIELALNTRQDAQGRAWALIAVDDRGPGVPPDQRERIFEPFYRIPGASEKEGSVGLGLSLVRRIVQQHGGQVGCTDNPHGGARFWVTLPQKSTEI